MKVLILLFVLYVLSAKTTALKLEIIDIFGKYNHVKTCRMTGVNICLNVYIGAMCN